MDGALCRDFENRGAVVGVTMPHPHGQIYGYSVIPKKIELEYNSFAEHKEETGRCLMCDMLEDEVDAKDRIIFENDDFIVFLPFFCEYPYGIYIAARKPRLRGRSRRRQARSTACSTTRSPI